MGNIASKLFDVKKRVVISAHIHTQEKITAGRAFNIFNGSIPYFAKVVGNNSSVFKIRNQALSAFIEERDEDHQKALFKAFHEWMPHWECCREFSMENLFEFIKKLSCPSCFSTVVVRLSITAETYKNFTSRRNKVASIKKKVVYCLVCPDKKATKTSKKGLQLCTGCLTLVGKSLARGWLSKNAKEEEVLFFLKLRREEKREKAALVKKRLMPYKSYERR